MTAVAVPPPPPPPVAAADARLRVAGPTALGLAGLGAVGWVSQVDPNQPGHYPSCLFLQLTGLECPGCGTLRAVHALTNGDVVAAIDLNVLTTLLLPLLAIGWLAWMWSAIRRQPVRVMVPPMAGYAIAIAVPVFWVLRNLEPFAFLAP